MPNTSSPSRIQLPPVPADHAGDPVAAWSESVWIDTYLPDDPVDLPAFLDSRVYQGSSGRVFPLPFHDHISQTKAPRQWQAVHLENQWVRLMIMPELGGRIHIGYDKSAGYDFFYRNNVIKPALVGLTGPWISGGVEFNWPQHHRPGTFLPTDVHIEREDDGAVTVWCSDHDPFARMKGMHGIRLRPDSNVVEARVRLYNRSETTKTFLWWANVAAAVHDGYQSFFPTDVHSVADHARRAFASFPSVDGRYYGVDYPAQVAAGDADGDRLDWYRNIPVPTSYMVVDTGDSFFGGYDHDADAGFVHIADRGIAPGKKQWTWGCSDFGQAWDANLTDDDGPYVELMAGVYTDNQPDFSHIAPGETKAFSQYWFPIHGIGPAHQATTDAALRVDVEPRENGCRVRIGVSSSGVHPAARIRLEDVDGRILHEAIVELAPGKPAILDLETDGPHFPSDLCTVVSSEGIELVRWRAPVRPEPTDLPAAAVEPPAPGDVGSVDELFLIGQYLAQHRHATHLPEPYWHEALRRDPSDVRVNMALAGRLHSAAAFAEAEEHLRTAVNRLTTWVANPADAQAHYLLCLVLAAQGRDKAAHAAFTKATWIAGWRVPAHFELAKISARAGDHSEAARHCREVLSLDGAHLQAADLLALLLRVQGKESDSAAVLEATLALDPLDQWARDLAGLVVTTDAPTLLDTALEYADCGFTDLALTMLGRAAGSTPLTAQGQVQAAPLIEYHRAYLLAARGDAEGAKGARVAAQQVDGRYAQASRLADVRALEAAVDADPQDGRAALLLGNWYYDKSRYEPAAKHWKQVLAILTDKHTEATAARNLAIAAYNVDGDPGAAVAYFEQAIAVAGDDAKLWCEFDQLASRTGVDGQERLARLRSREPMVLERDDLTITYARLLIEAGEPAKAREILQSRRFQPWEGGEGIVLDVWEAAALSLAEKAMAAGDPESAEALIRSAIESPDNLGEKRHPLANAANLHLALGDAHAAQGDDTPARAAWREAASSTGDFQALSTQPFGVQTFYSAVALLRLGERQAAQQLTADLEAYTRTLEETPARVDYFATSLPAMLLFHDDPQKARDDEVRVLRAQLAQLSTSAPNPSNATDTKEYQ